MIPTLRDPAYIGGLVMFERVASRLSFSAAAKELHVTPSAVSHRIRGLEQALGQRLFDRSPQSVRLTQEGQTLLAAVKPAFALLRSATETLTQQHVLELSIGPFLSAHWLMPRLADFENAHPNIRITLKHRIGHSHHHACDIAIVWAPKPPPSATALFNPTCIPVAAPGQIHTPQLWQSGFHPLHYRNRDLWREWLREVNGPSDYAERGEVFEDPNLLLEAAVHKRGIAMGFFPFIDAQLRSRRLARAHTHTLESRWRYWLVSPHAEQSPPLRLFCDWLESQALALSLCDKT